jgi:hypothetical protein
MTRGHRKIRRPVASAGTTSASQMSRDELEEARERVEWLAQEIWEAAVYGPLEERSRPTADDTGEGESGG